MNANRLLFASIHSYLDPSSGAALATRELLELLAARGWDCRALTCGVLDYQQETPLEDVLTALELPAQRAGAALSRGGQAEVFDLNLDGVRADIIAHRPQPGRAGTQSIRGKQIPRRGRAGNAPFPAPGLLTYGGHPVSLQLMQLARTLGIAVVFHLHNFGYNDRRGFADVSTVIFPSEYSRRHFQRKIGLDGTVIPDPIRLDRVVADNPQPKYVTFINPQPDKGATVFARIALELNRRRRTFRCWSSRAEARPTPWHIWPSTCRG